ncbi:MAG: apolipoprotein N-acyltransferase, partial [Rhodoferax sp.]|nr:apolipoprotein N-acyltransferase [Rhodoferax sp.]
MPPASARVRPSAYLGRGLLLVLAGCCAAAAVCWPFAFGFIQGQPVWWLQMLALVPLCRVLLHCSSAKQAFGWTAVFACAWLAATFWWLYIAMHTYGGLPATLTVIAVLALAALLALYYAAAGSVFWWLADAKAAQLSLVFAALWTMAEMARGTWLTG